MCPRVSPMKSRYFRLASAYVREASRLAPALSLACRSARLHEFWWKDYHRASILCQPARPALLPTTRRQGETSVAAVSSLMGDPQGGASGGAIGRLAGPALDSEQAAKLLVLMCHARGCPGHHRSPRLAEVCHSFLVYIWQTPERGTTWPCSAKTRAS